MSFTLVIRSDDASSRSSVAEEANSDFSVNIPMVIPEELSTQRFKMSLRAVGIDATDIPAELFEVHVDLSSAQNFYDTKTHGPSTLVGICSISNAFMTDTGNVDHLFQQHAELISSFSKIVYNPNHSVIRVRYIDLVTQTAITQDPPAAIVPNLIVLEFEPISD